jgi:hypothetical protein
MRPLSRFVIAALLIGSLPGLILAQDKFFDSNGVRIRYVEQGSGEPCCHSNRETAEVFHRAL